jgi:hypothetical protein
MSLTGDKLHNELKERFSSYIAHHEDDPLFVWYPEDSTEFKECPLCLSERGDSILKYTTTLRIEQCKTYIHVTVKICHECLCLGTHAYFMKMKKYPKMRAECEHFHRLLLDNDKEKLKVDYGYPDYEVPKMLKIGYYSTYNNHILEKLIKKYHDDNGSSKIINKDYNILKSTYEDFNKKKRKNDYN